MNEPISSVPEDGWRDTAAAVRLKINQRIADMDEMKPEDLKHFIEAARNALWLEMNATTFDKHVDLEMNRFVADD